MHMHELSAKPSPVGRWLVPILLVTLLGYTWFTLQTSDVNPLWQHWLGLFGIIAVAFACFRDARFGVLITTVYVILAIFSLFALLPSLTITRFNVGPLPIPIGQPVAWPFFIVHICLNFNALVDYYLDWKENKAA